MQPGWADQSHQTSECVTFLLTSKIQTEVIHPSNQKKANEDQRRPATTFSSPLASGLLHPSDLTKTIATPTRDD